MDGLRLAFDSTCEMCGETIVAGVHWAEMVDGDLCHARCAAGDTNVEGDA